ncbi:TPA: hypothetical protein L4G86_005372 [Pseudomonas aeruginosa]|nr:hypothetical protein [Pseudomonas aeruginosa]
MTITANMVSLSLSTVGPPGGRIRLGSLLGVDAGIPASVSVARGFGDQVHEHFAQLLAICG